MSALSQRDRESLYRLGLEWSETVESGHVCLVIRGWRLPSGYEPDLVDMLVRLPAGYPDIAPDMFWCAPRVKLLATNSSPQATEMTERHLGREWQRFSRHLPPGSWVPGEDDLESYLGVIRGALAEEAA